MRRYPFYLSYDEADFIIVALTKFELQQGFRARAAIDRLVDRITRTQKFLVEEVAVRGDEVDSDQIYTPS